MLRQKLEKSEKSRNELRQNADLLESKVPHPSCVGSLWGVRSVDGGGDDAPDTVLSALQASSK